MMFVASLNAASGCDVPFRSDLKMPGFIVVTAGRKLEVRETPGAVGRVVSNLADEKQACGSSNQVIVGSLDARNCITSNFLGEANRQITKRNVDFIPEITFNRTAPVPSDKATGAKAHVFRWRCSKILDLQVQWRSIAYQPNRSHAAEFGNYRGQVDVRPQLLLERITRDGRLLQGSVCRTPRLKEAVFGDLCRTPRFSKREQNQPSPNRGDDGSGNTKEQAPERDIRCFFSRTNSAPFGAQVAVAALVSMLAGISIAGAYLLVRWSTAKRIGLLLAGSMTLGGLAWWTSPCEQQNKTYGLGAATAPAGLQIHKTAPFANVRSPTGNELSNHWTNVGDALGPTI